ncbi:phosphotransferase [Halodesulfovibrio marinisediminis]|uniref:Phosphotransferase enzyme family protein n=1 Tax=Halodesulfovibrio marinisediminis DSM 17456 TaxID=1121457 RepID=A0A1N6J235_9BACT|nr:phosphotransferase [Halodesulfovibrio marinisediminis]SIO38327.1 Phosphotransferase enzyme family protein [Halodesulfovibrio marinisediminis DSM 17456]
MNKKNIIARYLHSSNWLEKLKCRSIADVSFLAAGEYNENWIVTATTQETTFHRKFFVFRINHGSQLGLGAKQIGYEFNVLSALKNSSVTPIPYFYDAKAGNFDPAFNHGVLLMEFLSGTPLDYAQDLDYTAKIFATVHTQPVPEQNKFIYQQNPVTDIVTESLGLLARFNAHPKKEIRHKLEVYSNEIRKLGEEYAAAFAAEPQIIVNTEVNSGNFIINRENNTAHLVDWEKAVVSSRYQDLGHFIVPTTTLWKTDFIATQEHRLHFLSRYKEHAGLENPIEELSLLTGILEKTIILRGLSWCYMAWYEYTQQDRVLKNNATFRTIERYLDNIEWFLQ